MAELARTILRKNIRQNQVCLHGFFVHASVRRNYYNNGRIPEFFRGTRKLF